MKRLVLDWRCLLLLTACTFSNCVADDLGDAVRSSIDCVSPSVLRIRIVGAPDRAGDISSRVTTGVVVSTDGEIVSSSFGFGGEIAAIFVETSGGERHGAEIVATDHVRKLVLLRAQVQDLPPPVWAVEDPAVGAWALAVGRFYASPRPSVALGVVSAVNRIHGLAIQTDAKVSPINYGGPLVGMDGSVYGILVPLAPANEATGVTAGVKWYDSGIGFAIPAIDVLDSAERLRTGSNRSHGVLGVRFATQSPLSEQIIVKSVHPGSPAETGGIRTGDRIRLVNGHQIQRLGGLQSILKRSWAGDNLLLVIQRGGDELQVKVTLADELLVTKDGWLGIVPLAPASTSDIEGGGVLVGVLTDSSAADAELPNPCIVSMVDEEAVDSLKQLRSALGEVKVGDALELTIASTDRPAERRVVSVVARPKMVEELARLSQEVASIRGVLTTDSIEEWGQSRINISENTHAWVIGPIEELQGAELGVVILLHDGEPVTNTLLQDWREVCQQYQLVLAVLYSEHMVPFGSVDTVRVLLAKISELGLIDPDRLAMVTRDSHSGFVTRVLLNQRIRSLRQAVFIGCRPTIDGVSLESMGQKKPSLLLFPSADDKQALALLSSSTTKFRNAGAEVLVSSSAADARGVVQAREIAHWMLWQQIR